MHIVKLPQTSLIETDSNMRVYSRVSQGGLRSLSALSIYMQSTVSIVPILQVIKMLLTIIGVFLLCWGPKLVLNILKRHTGTLLHTDEAFYIMVSFI